MKLSPDSSILSNFPNRSIITTSACFTIITPLYTNITAAAINNKVTIDIKIPLCLFFEFNTHD